MNADYLNDDYKLFTSLPNELWKKILICMSEFDLNIFVSTFPLFVYLTGFIKMKQLIFEPNYNDNSMCSIRSFNNFLMLLSSDPKSNCRFENSFVDETSLPYKMKMIFTHNCTVDYIKNHFSNEQKPIIVVSDKDYIYHINKFYKIQLIERMNIRGQMNIAILNKISDAHKEKNQVFIANVIQINEGNIKFENVNCRYDPFN